jgi:hypothetical protein
LETRLSVILTEKDILLFKVKSFDLFHSKLIYTKPDCHVTVTNFLLYKFQDVPETSPIEVDMSDVKQKRLCVLSASLLMIITGTLLIFSAPVLLKFIIRSMLVLKPGTHMCDVWEHFPDPVPTDMYLFNWTNPEEIRNKSVKPRFQQVGPYRFMMDVRKSNITWNDNGTVTFRQLKYWYYNKEDSKGDLHDKVTTLHLTALVSANFQKLSSVQKNLKPCSADYKNYNF